MEAISSARGVPMSQVALNWVRSRPLVSSVLLGCRTVSQLEENLGALEWELESDEMERLGTASAPGVPSYPQGFLEEYAGVKVWEDLGTRNEPVLG